MKTGLIVLGLCLIWVPSGIKGSDSPKFRMSPMEAIKLFQFIHLINTCYYIKKNSETEIS